MKPFAVFILALLTLCVKAQNWSPAIPTDTLNYRLDGDPEITASCIVTTFTANAGDTLFSYNRVGCDSCITVPSAANCQSCYGLLDLPVPVTGYSILHAAGDQYTITGNDTFLLEAMAHTGDSWTFEASQGVTAQVAAEYLSTVLGQPDSVKVALLSTGDSVMWSKAHGILLWPELPGSGTYYRLVGMNGRDLGEQMLTFDNYFGFSVGEVLQYHYEFSNPNQPYIWRDEKNTILSAQKNGSTWSYTVQRVYKETDQSGWINNGPPPTYTTTSGSYILTIEIDDIPDHMGNCFNHAMTKGEYTWTPLPQNYTYENISRTMTDPNWYEAELFTDSVGNHGIHYGWQNNAGFGYPLNSHNYGNIIFVDAYLGSIPLNSHTDTLVGGYSYAPSANPNGWGGAGAAFTNRLGVTCLWGSNYFEGGMLRKLTGYVLDNDTVGTILADSYLLGNDQSPAQLKIQVYPNPATDMLRIDYPSSVPAQLTITDLQGRIMVQEEISGTTDMDCSQWTEGLYFVSIRTGNESAMRKLVISH